MATGSARERCILGEANWEMSCCAIKMEPNFNQLAQDEFHLLVDQYGFTVETPRPNVTRYLSDKVIIEINYSPRNEVDVIVDTNPPSHRFQFRLFLKLFHPDVEKALGYGIAYSDEDICRELKQLSEALERYGAPILRGDRLLFDKIKNTKWWELPP
jgi:hypothetical protein